LLTYIFYFRKYGRRSRADEESNVRPREREWMKEDMRELKAKMTKLSENVAQLARLRGEVTCSWVESVKERERRQRAEREMERLEAELRAYAERDRLRADRQKRRHETRS
jgi:hypothetical protein